jgi:DNA-binding CsgD family transcriptional regulator
LTKQERRVLQLLAEGKSPSTVARELGINPRTLRNHLHHINQKLHTHNRLEAVIQATRRGMIQA